MSMTARIIYQPYHVSGYAGLQPGTPLACRSPEDALRRAERAYKAGLVAGADVVRVYHDEEADEFGDPEFLSRIGQTPDGDEEE
ncbi:hypothetical protein [Rhizosaccharibacter radicis]|uniref:Aminopeptidase n=1 Tax=Rhizosaccharibacter radicis TaxID=2782605 RepID=A0ABT1VZ08_9PROT|nr:aminopeptidase [Acetobacteraceae bacterium KSS12]